MKALITYFDLHAAYIGGFVVILGSLIMGFDRSLMVASLIVQGRLFVHYYDYKRMDSYYGGPKHRCAIYLMANEIIWAFIALAGVLLRHIRR